MPDSKPLQRFVAFPRGGPRLVKLGDLPAQLAADPRTRALVLEIRVRHAIVRCHGADGACCGEFQHADGETARRDAAARWPADVLVWTEVPPGETDPIAFAARLRP